jgi:hypothetical protein
MSEHEDRMERFGTPAQAAEWDARYADRDGTMWSGRANGRLNAELRALGTSVSDRNTVVRRDLSGLRPVHGRHHNRSAGPSHSDGTRPGR